jgi:ABC-type Fe3+ transport system permease subunit
MTRVQKIGCWLGAVVSLVAALYAGISVFFYAWLNAAEPENWPVDRAEIWAYSSLALAVLFAVLCTVCVILLVRDSRQKKKEVSSAV